jgi:glycerol-3-phosphate acyltransferase PlsY
VFYGFKGGKGILVSAGIILILDPIVFLVILAVFGIVVAISKIVSLASISAAVAFPIATLIHGLIVHSDVVWFDTLSALLIGGIVVFMHRSNIKRLLNGTENKFGKKK